MSAETRLSKAMVEAEMLARLKLAKADRDAKVPGWNDKHNVMPSPQFLDNGGGIQLYLAQSSDRLWAWAPDPDEHRVEGRPAMGLDVSELSL